MQHTKRILLIDDDGDDRDIFVNIIKEIDPQIECMTANDAESALKILHTENQSLVPDLMFVDMNMPIVTGEEFIRKYRQQEEEKEVPIIIYSGTPVLLETQKKLLSLGVTKFIVKSANIDTLRKEVYNILIQFSLATSVV